MSFVKPTNGSSAVRFRATNGRNVRRNTSSPLSRFGSSLKSIVFAVLLGTMDILRLVPKFAWIFLITLIVAAMVIKSFQKALDVPTVYQSFDTHQCVKVINADGTAGDCAKLPERYNRVWAE
jgi:hypothetical protein